MAVDRRPTPHGTLTTFEASAGPAPTPPATRPLAAAAASAALLNAIRMDIPQERCRAVSNAPQPMQPGTDAAGAQLLTTLFFTRVPFSVAVPSL